MRTLLLLLACFITLGAAEGKLTITGSSTIAPVAAEIAKRFEKSHPGVRVDVQTGGSSRGVTDAASGLADIGMASRALKPDETVTAHLIALDGVAMIVHGSNAIPALTKEQVIGIYTGKLTDWSAVGGKAGQITVVNKAEGRSTLELFCHHFGLKNADIKAHVVIGDNEQGVKTVAGNPGAIGYVSIGTAQIGVESGVSIRMLPMDGVVASTKTVLDRTWPLARPLNLVTKGEPTGLVKEFIALAQSKDVDDLITDLAFVPPTR
jgi:phosphate transport system substrate-binding protein